MRPRRVPRRLRWVGAAGASVVVAALGAPATLSAPAPAPDATAGVAGATGAGFVVQAVGVRALPPPGAGSTAGPPSGPPSGPALGTGSRFRVLQMNLCNSGRARCYAVVNNGRSVAEAYGVIRSTRPDLVTVNEICRSDAVDGLLPAMRRNWPDDWVFAAFMPAYDRRTGGPYRCRNGDQYGMGVLGRVAAASWHSAYALGGRYPDTHAGTATQDTGSPEVRSWLCTVAVDAYLGCTTHLASSSRAVADHQCRYLMSGVLPALVPQPGPALPGVVAGDLNLLYRGSPDVQHCVRPGWFRKGDGQVQHVMATTRFAFDVSRVIAMRHSDHPALLVSLTGS